jgi:hypothetical protein
MTDSQNYGLVDMFLDLFLSSNSHNWLKAEYVVQGICLKVMSQTTCITIFWVLDENEDFWTPLDLLNQNL